jgi:deoxycytidylate deaminase
VKEKYQLAFMDMAERFAQTSEAVRLKVAALIVKNDSIIS